MTNPELRARLLAQIPDLEELEPDDLEYVLQVEEDMAEFRETGVMPRRLGERLAKARQREERDPFEAIDANEWAAVVEEAWAELKAESTGVTHQTERRALRAKHKAVS